MRRLIGFEDLGYALDVLVGDVGRLQGILLSVGLRLLDLRTTMFGHESALLKFGYEILVLLNHLLLGRRCEKYLRLETSSIFCICPSIHPKHSASSRASHALSVLGPPALPKMSQMTSSEDALPCNHFLNSLLSANRKSSLKLASCLQHNTPFRP